MRLFLLLFHLLPLAALAQQTPLLSRYQYTPAWLNPGLAGATATPEVRALFRQQWLGLDGAPSTQMVYADLPLQFPGFGLNACLTNDQAGALAHTEVRVNYAYRVRLNSDLSVHIGLGVEMGNWRTQWQKLTLADADDPTFQNNFNQTTANFGAGVAVRYRRWQFGYGMPQTVLNRLDNTDDFVSSRTARHFFFHASTQIPLSNSELQLTPRALLRLTNGVSGGTSAPTATDLGLGLRWQNHLEFATSWRTALERNQSSDDALAISGNWLIHNRLQLGATYEVPLTALRNVSGGSVEIMAGYIFQARKGRKPPEESVVIPIQKPLPGTPASTPAPTTDETPDGVFPCQVSGIVFEMTTGLPSESARVTLTNTCGAPVPKAYITGADGRYKFQLQPGCCYTVKVEKDGFKAGVSTPQCPEKVLRAQVFRADLDLNR